MKSQDLKDLDAAKARHESIKADRAELAHKIELGEYISRSAYRQAAATIIASFSQATRSIPDTLERQLGLDAKVTEAVARILDAALDDLANDLSMLSAE